MLRAGRHLARTWYPGIGRGEVLLAAAGIALASGIVAGTVLAQRAGPLDGWAPTTLTAPAPTIPPTTHPTTATSRPPGGSGAAQSTLGGSGPTPTTLGPPGSSQPPATTLGAPATTAPATTVGEPTTTCRIVVTITAPHISLRICKKK